jgi:hypothetical protein
MCVVLFVTCSDPEVSGLAAAGHLDAAQAAVLNKVNAAMPADLHLDNGFGEWSDVDAQGRPVMRG